MVQDIFTFNKCTVKLRKAEREKESETLKTIELI